jgi:calcineurin-like phosphoesterase family protein
MTIFFTADTHFGHDNIRRYCDRPYASIEEMDEDLIARWNAAVGSKDEVWHLGDFAMCCDPEHAQRILKRLNGNKHLIVGNHDKIGAALEGWGSIHTFKDLNAGLGQRVFLFHYALRVWPASEIGSINLYGHTHGDIPDTWNGCDVGVDCWNYRPINIEAIKNRLAALPEYSPAGVEPG